MSEGLLRTEASDREGRGLCEGALDTRGQTHLPPPLSEVTTGTFSHAAFSPAQVVR